MRSETKALGLIDTAENCWDTFISKVKNNLHMVFTASPVGENFRVRSQRFLATVTSTVIDWCVCVCVCVSLCVYVYGCGCG